MTIIIITMFQIFAFHLVYAGFIYYIYMLFRETLSGVEAVLETESEGSRNG